MKYRLTFYLAALMLALAVLAGCGGSGAPNVDWTLSVANADETLLTLSYQQLVEMTQTDLNDVLMERSTGENIVTSWSGVALTALFEQAGVTEYASITAVAADGYAIEIPLDELEGAIVALKDGGEWIATADADAGPIRLVCPQAPGNRWVFQLVEIRVNP